MGPVGLVEWFSPATFSCLGKGRQLFNLFIPKFPPNIFDHRNLLTAPKSLHKMLVYAQTIRGYRKYWYPSFSSFLSIEGINDNRGARSGGPAGESRY